MGDVMKEASFSLAEVKFAASGDISHTVLHNVSKASVRVRFSKENVAGELVVDKRGPLSFRLVLLLEMFVVLIFCAFIFRCQPPDFQSFQ